MWGDPAFFYGYTCMFHAELRENIASIVENAGVHLVDLNIVKSRNSVTVEVFVDTEQGITVDELASVHSLVRPALEQWSDDPDSIIVEVSSPGLDQPLRFPWQYVRHTGRTLAVTYSVEDSPVSVTGIMSGVTDESVELECNSDIIKIPFGLIQKAMVQISF
jgi:ribosome maturation factor RimP